MRKAWLSWSSGKDSAWALHRMRLERRFDVCGLFTTLNQSFDRVAMHAVRRTLLERQARAAGLPLQVIPLPWPCPNARYEAIMGEFCEKAVEMGIEALAFGDLFLEDVRQYRMDRLEATPLEPVFPLWKSPTADLAREMIHSGLRAKLTCVNPKHLNRSFAGRDFDRTLLAELPDTVDPCGENGEFHSFVYEGPMFEHPLEIHVGDIIERDGFVFADVISKVDEGES